MSIIGKRRRIYRPMRLSDSDRMRLRDVEAEEKRRIPRKIEQLERELEEMRERHRLEYRALFDELVRYYRAQPGTKYDRTAKKGK